MASLDEDTKIAMQENMTLWKEKRVGTDSSIQHGSNSTETKPASVPRLGLGEWDEELGVPLSIICVRSEKIEALERDQGWQDEQFDFLTQWLRCVLLKHGASLVYTASFDANNVRTLVHSSLSILSLLKRDVAKPNYIERDKILIPPNWDSWGKIRPLREDTDLEAISNAWSVEIQGNAQENPNFAPSDNNTETQDSAVAIFESTLPKPTPQPTSFQPKFESEDIVVPSVQEFLQQQAKTLEILAEDDARIAKRKQQGDGTGTSTPTIDESSNKSLSNAGMADKIGPYQINVNGIDFDAEEATRRLRERETERNASPRRSESRSAVASGVSTPPRRGANLAGGDESKTSNEAMSAFFANLIKKDKRGGSGAVSPTRGSPAPERRGE